MSRSVFCAFIDCITNYLRRPSSVQENIRIENRSRGPRRNSGLHRNFCPCSPLVRVVHFSWRPVAKYCFLTGSFGRQSDRMFSRMHTHYDFPEENRLICPNIFGGAEHPPSNVWIVQIVHLFENGSDAALYQPQDLLYLQLRSRRPSDLVGISKTQRSSGHKLLFFTIRRIPNHY